MSRALPCSQDVTLKGPRPTYCSLKYGWEIRVSLFSRYAVSSRCFGRGKNSRCSSRSANA
jgi:hypothetical protein